jgi:hypothetical protein
MALLGDTTRVSHALYALLPTRILIGLHPETATAPFTLALAMLSALALEQLISRRWQWPAVAVAAADLILVSSGRPMNAMPYAENPAQTEAVTRLRALTQVARPPARIDTVNDSIEWAMAAPLTHIYTASGSDVMAPERVMQARLAFCRGERWGAWYQVSNLRSPVLGMMNVRYVLSREPIPDAAPLEPAATLPGRYVYENRGVLPRFYLVARTRTAHSLVEAAAMLRAPDFRPAEEAIVEGAPPLASTAPPGQVEVVRYRYQTVELKVNAPDRQYLVTSETHYPGWRAWIDGSPQPIFYTNAGFRGLMVPAGRHAVRMQFAPASLRYAAMASAAAWLVWMWCWWRPIWPGAVRAPERRQPGRAH